MYMYIYLDICVYFSTFCAISPRPRVPAWPPAGAVSLRSNFLLMLRTRLFFLIFASVYLPVFSLIRRFLCRRLAWRSLFPKPSYSFSSSCVNVFSYFLFISAPLSLFAVPAQLIALLFLSPHPVILSTLLLSSLFSHPHLPSFTSYALLSFRSVFLSLCLLKSPLLPIPLPVPSGPPERYIIPSQYLRATAAPCHCASALLSSTPSPLLSSLHFSPILFFPFLPQLLFPFFAYSPSLPSSLSLSLSSAPINNSFVHIM